MRKIEKSMIEAIESGRNWTSQNTLVNHESGTGGRIARVYLHGHHVATVAQKGDRVEYVAVCAAGWHTRTTTSRLHAIVSHYYPGDGFVNLHRGVIRASVRGPDFVDLEHTAATFYRGHDYVLRVEPSML